MLGLIWMVSVYCVLCMVRVEGGRKSCRPCQAWVVCNNGQEQVIHRRYKNQYFSYFVLRLSTVSHCLANCCPPWLSCQRNTNDGIGCPLLPRIVKQYFQVSGLVAIAMISIIVSTLTARIRACTVRT